MKILLSNDDGCHAPGLLCLRDSLATRHEVRVVAPDRLEIPDYDGNRMFNTLGNLAADPRIGITFPGLDAGPDAGRVLQLSGTAEIDFDPARAARIPGAQRVLTVRIARVVDRRGAFAPRYWLRERSPFNPPAA